MRSRIKMPKLGMSMEEGIVAEWLVPDGGAVEAGQPLYLLETDKVQNEVPSPLSGIVTHVAVEGESYAVGDVIAELEH